MLSIFKKPPTPEQIAKENAQTYLSLMSEIKSYMPSVSEELRENWLRVTVQRLAENLKWRQLHVPAQEMDHPTSENFRREAKRLLARANSTQRRSKGRGIDEFSKYAADRFASAYLTAESLCFEYPYVLDPIFEQESLGQKRVLRDVNGLLREYGFADVGRTLPS